MDTGTPSSHMIKLRMVYSISGVMTPLLSCRWIQGAIGAGVAMHKRAIKQGVRETA